MRRALVAALIAGIVSHLPFEVRAAQRPELAEIAFVANAEAGTVALVDVASRSILGVIDVNPGHAERKGPGATNYAQDTDVSPDGRTLYVSRGYLGDVAAFDIATARMVWRQVVEHWARRPHDDHAGRDEPVRLGAHGQSRLPALRFDG